MLRNRKHDIFEHTNPAPPVNGPVPAPTQIQSQNPIGGNVNPAMAQFLMQGHGFPGAVTQYHPMMPNYSMPNYPYVPTYPPPHRPHPFPFPQQYVSPQAQAYGCKCRYNWNEPVSPISNPVVDDAEAIPIITISYPLVSDWLQRM